MAESSNGTIGVGFGTAALGQQSYQITMMALEAGFRKFDTAEADWWYDQKSVGSALSDFFGNSIVDDDEWVATPANDNTCGSSKKACKTEDLRISTKIPPWSLTSDEDIRAHARNSRNELVGFCDNEDDDDDDDANGDPFPMDVYYIHAPQCWKGWHPRCDNPPPTLNLHDAWRAMEAVVGVDRSAKRIGLSNVHPQELNALLQNIHERKGRGDTNPPPRLPDVLQSFADPLQPAEELREICKQHGIEFVSYSTLGTQHRDGNDGNPVLANPIVLGLASKHGRSVAEVVLSWALQNDMSVIPRSSKKEHILELARLLTVDPTFLDPGDLQAMDTMKHLSS